MRNIPIVTKNLLIINIIAYLVTLMMETSGVDLNSLLGQIGRASCRERV